MAGQILTGSFARAVLPIITKFYPDNEEKLEKYYLDLAKVVDMEMGIEEDTTWAGLGAAQVKPEGDNAEFDTMAQYYYVRYVALTYALGFAISYEMIADGHGFDVLDKKLTEIMNGQNTSLEVNVASIYNNAFSSSYTGGDGVSLCNSAHPLYGQGAGFGNTTSNLGSAATLSEASLESMWINLYENLNNRGLRNPLRPQSLIVPPQLAISAQKILQTEQSVFTADNTKNVIRGYFTDGYKVNPYLTSSTAYFVRTNMQDNGVQLRMREEPRIFAPHNSYDDFGTRVQSIARYTAGWSDFRGIWGNAGA